MRSNALQDRSLIESDTQDSPSSEMNTTNNIIVAEQEISKYKVRYKQRRQKLGQQKSVLETHNMYYTGNKTLNYSTAKSHVPCQYCGSADHS